MNKARNANPLKYMEKTSKTYNQHKHQVRSTYLFGFIQTSPHELLEALVVEQLRKVVKDSVPNALHAELSIRILNYSGWTGEYKRTERELKMHEDTKKKKKLAN